MGGTQRCPLLGTQILASGISTVFTLGGEDAGRVWHDPHPHPHAVLGRTVSVDPSRPSAFCPHGRACSGHPVRTGSHTVTVRVRLLLPSVSSPRSVHVGGTCRAHCPTDTGSCQRGSREPLGTRVCVGTPASGSSGLSLPGPTARACLLRWERASLPTGLPVWPGLWVPWPAWAPCRSARSTCVKPRAGLCVGPHPPSLQGSRAWVCGPLVLRWSGPPGPILPSPGASYTCFPAEVSRCGAAWGRGALGSFLGTFWVRPGCPDDGRLPCLSSVRHD